MREIPLTELTSFMPLIISAVGRTLIPRFFRSIFEGGVTDLHWELRHTKESFHQAVVSLDCDQATMVTQHGKPMFTKVCYLSSDCDMIKQRSLQVYTEGRLIVEFNFDDLMRIRSWHFAIRNHRELIPRSVIAMQVKPHLSSETILVSNIYLVGARYGGNSVKEHNKTRSYCNYP